MYVAASFLKRLSRNRLAQRMASAAISGWISLVDATTRWSFVGEEHLTDVEAGEKGFILAFWHSRLLMIPAVRARTPRRVFMLISTHRDGEIITDAVRKFGVEFIRGSAANPRKAFKDKSGAPAVLQMIAALEEGHIVGVTPDGPRGPARAAQQGVLRLAARSGAPILPIAYATRRGLTIGSWDRFFLAAPFSRGAFAAAAPVPAPVDDSAASLASSREKLTAALDEALFAAETAVGRSPSPPRSR